MKKGTKYAIIGTSLLLAGVASYFILRNRGEDVGEQPDPNAPSLEDVEEQNTSGETAIQVGDEIYPVGEYANVRSSMEVDDGFFHNKLRRVYSPNQIGEVTEVNTVGNHTWYRVDMSNVPSIQGNTAWDLTPDGYVRADVVTKE